MTPTRCSQNTPRRNIASNSTEHASTGHHVMAKYELRAGAVKTRSAAARGVVAKRRGLDGAENSATLNDVMDARCVWLSKRGQKYVR